MRLACIFDDRQVVPLRDSLNGIHVRRLAIKVNRNHRGNATAGFPVNQLSGFLVEVTLDLAVLTELRRVHVVSTRIDIDETGHGPSL